MLKKMILSLGRFLLFYEKFVRPFLITLMAIMTILCLYAVFMRYVLNAAPTWSEELTRYLMVWGALLGMGVAMRHGKHIGLSSLVQAIWRRLTPFMLILADLVNLIFWITVFVTGITMTIIVAEQRSPSLNLPMWIAYIPVPIGGFFFMIEALHKMLRKIANDAAIEEEYKEWDLPLQY